VMLSEERRYGVGRDGVIVCATAASSREVRACNQRDEGGKEEKDAVSRRKVEESCQTEKLHDAVGEHPSPMTSANCCSCRKLCRHWHHDNFLAGEIASQISMQHHLRWVGRHLVEQLRGLSMTFQKLHQPVGKSF